MSTPPISRLTPLQAHQNARLLQLQQIAAQQQGLNPFGGLGGALMTGISAPGSTPCASPRLLEKEVVAGPILTYRVWTIRIGTGQLWSTGIGDASWAFGDPQPARCKGLLFNESHDPPMSGCQCGYWTLTEWKAAEDLARSMSSIIGKAAIWGKVIKLAHGYRSQYAYPYELYRAKPVMAGFPVSDTWEKEWQMIVANYGCVVVNAP